MADSDMNAISDIRLNVGIFIFDEVEVLDFAGPFEVFSRTRLVPGVESRRGAESAPYNVFTVAERMGPLSRPAAYGLAPARLYRGTGHRRSGHTRGMGTRSLLEYQPVLEWVRETAERARVVPQSVLARCCCSCRPAP